MKFNADILLEKLTRNATTYFYLFLCIQLPFTVLINKLYGLRGIGIVVSGAVMALLVTTIVLMVGNYNSRLNNVKKHIALVSAMSFMGLVGLRVLNDLIAERGAYLSILASSYHYLVALLFFAILYIYGHSENATNFFSKYAKLIIIATSGIYIFAIMQYFVLPKDILDLLGYGSQGIRAFQYVGSDMDNIRVMSVLSGPNTLGVYAALVLPLLLYAWKKAGSVNKTILAIMIIATPLVIFVSKSRSGFVGLLVVVLLEVLRYRREIFTAITKHSKASFFIGISLILSVIVVSPNIIGFVQSTLMRGATNAGAGSDTQRIDSWSRSTEEILNEPLGHGLGTAGIGSTYRLDGRTNIIESSYLQIAYELGWLGLCLWLIFCLIVVYLALSLVDRDKRYLASSLIFSFMIVNLFLPLINEEVLSFLPLTIIALILPMNKRSKSLSWQLPKLAKLRTRLRKLKGNA